MSIATEIERIKKAKENIINTLKANDIQIEETASIDELDLVMNKVPILDTTDATATAEDILKDKTAYVNGEKVTGTLEAGSGLNIKITDCSYLFAHGAKKEYYNEFLSCCENVTSLRGMFYYYDGATVDFSNFIDTSNVTHMGYMFQGSSLTSIDLTKLDTSEVTAMPSMINNCKSVVSVDMSNLDLTNVTDVGYMFSSGSNLVDLNLSGISIPKVTRMEGMFNSCTKLSNESINYILGMCATATSYTGTKTLEYIGFKDATLRNRAASCANYTAFRNAGWRLV